MKSIAISFRPSQKWSNASRLISTALCAWTRISGGRENIRKMGYRSGRRAHAHGSTVQPFSKPIAKMSTEILVPSYSRSDETLNLKGWRFPFASSSSGRTSNPFPAHCKRHPPSTPATSPETISAIAKKPALSAEQSLSTSGNSSIERIRKSGRAARRRFSVGKGPSTPIARAWRCGQ